MKSVKLNKRIDIQNYVRVENEVSEEVKQWQSYVTLWAMFYNSNVNRQLEVKAEKETASIFYEIVIRYRNDIDTTMRVVYGGKKYNIDHVVNQNEQNIETHLFCTLIEEGVYNE